MKVSVIIPAYNAEKWIGKCLDSIIIQSYKDIEIIVVNDGSRDYTLEILSSYEKRDPRVIIINKKNSGTYLTRKQGVESAKGEFIFHCDADDYLEPKAIELLVKKQLLTGADIVIGNGYRVQNGKRKIITNHIPKQQNKISLIKALFNNEIKGYVWGKLYRKDLFKDIDYNFTDMLYEDVLVNLHILTHYNVKIEVENTPIHNYLIHGKSANSSKNPVFIENIIGSVAIAKKMLKNTNNFEQVQDEFKLMNCRTWIVYSRLGGKLAKNKGFRTNFKKENFTPYSKTNLALYHRLEMITYNYNYVLGKLLTNSMKQLNNLIG
ncbi:glycosyltransferase [Gillisia sp. M10.2A]|uniref:Glycosyltransferase n=1 Tax=Gillisia lutea TaxID=2909668 RepID=A0ABS9EH35_9FLAO|nr:glycosyltransferase family 2 protein [Gillisia lutea]MCF4102185.1 glycosyltransferase [Gillisia lutea]